MFSQHTHHRVSAHAPALRSACTWFSDMGVVAACPLYAVRSKEPLVSLARHRKIGGKTLFAMNLVPDSPYGRVRLGDPVEVLETR